MDTYRSLRRSTFLQSDGDRCYFCIHYIGVMSTHPEDDWNRNRINYAWKFSEDLCVLYLVSNSEISTCYILNIICYKNMHTMFCRLQTEWNLTRTTYCIETTIRLFIFKVNCLLFMLLSSFFNLFGWISLLL